ncbi:MAG: hypothetical protein J4428_02990 [Candidatus Aenigmarchaeota archaeon]|nr:hypothetical protein [Candidatus Aenigmarchaeota archaeon]
MIDFGRIANDQEYATLRGEKLGKLLGQYTAERPGSAWATKGLTKNEADEVGFSYQSALFYETKIGVGTCVEFTLDQSIYRRRVIG